MTHPRINGGGRTIVLVHGAWHGGWCYREVAKRLRSAGHDVYVPTLTGLGERAHLRNVVINLQTHVDDVANVLLTEDLHDVVLCGHSYGGMVVTGVADRLADRIAKLIYLDAFVPEKSGDSIASLVGRASLPDVLGDCAGDGLSVPPPPAAVFDVPEAHRAWVDAKCVSQPAATFLQGLPLTGGWLSTREKHYVLAESPLPEGGALNFRSWYDRFSQDPAWTVHRFSAGHDLMIDIPDDIAELIAA